MRCSWCSAPATTYVAAFYIPPCCDDDACAAESNAVNASLWDWRDAMAAAVESSGAAWASPLDVGAWRDARDAVIARDAAEQRGEPPDASGWTIW